MPKISAAKRTTKKVDSASVSLSVSPAKEAEALVDKVLEVVYPRLESLEYSTKSENGPVTPEDMKRILGWETESKYQFRMMQKYPDSDPKKHLFYDDFHCLDINKEKVRCHNNANNRPFDMDWCEDLIRMILHGQWAGPLTLPGETVNGEAIRISKYGSLLSGQHQGTALVLANERLQESRTPGGKSNPHYDPNDPLTDRYPFWRGHDHVVIETFIITGISEDERVLQTIDYVKPRSVADMLFTMDLYRNNSPVDRKEMTRMLDKAIDLLWTRTSTQGYRTHPEIVGFLQRHRTLLDTVQHLFTENKPVIVGSKKRLDNETDQEHKDRLIAQAAQGGRRISKLKLSAGQCAALCYLMGCSTTSESASEDYRNSLPPNEKDHLDWSLFDRAKLFWTNLAGSKTFVPVRTKLNSLFESEADKEENQGLGGRWEEKFAVLAKAWDVFKDHPDNSGDPFPYEVDPVTNQVISDDLEPEGALFLYYTNLDSEGKPLPPGEVNLIDIADFKGIDCPKEGSKKQEKKAPAPTKLPTVEEIYAQGERMRHEKIEKQDEKKESKRKRKIVRK